MLNPKKGNLAAFHLAIWQRFIWQFGSVSLGNLALDYLAIWQNSVIARPFINYSRLSLRLFTIKVIIHKKEKAIEFKLKKKRLSITRLIKLRF